MLNIGYSYLKDDWACLWYRCLAFEFRSLI